MSLSACLLEHWTSFALVIRKEVVETKQNTGMWSSRLGGLLAMCVPTSFLCVFSVLPHFLLWTCNAWGFKKKEKNKRYEKSNKNDFTWVCANHPGLPGSCHNLLKVGLGHVLPPWRGEPAKTGWLHSQGYHTQVIHSTCATRPKAEHIFFFQSLSLFNWLTQLFFAKWKKKIFFYLLKIHVVSFNSILQTRKDMFKFLRETFKGCWFKCEDKWAPRGYNFCQEEQIGPESKHSCFVFSSFEREKKKREEGEREREEGRRKEGRRKCVWGGEEVNQENH